MSERSIIVYGHPTLRERAGEVAEFGAELRALIDEMFAAMYADRGIGLAAPQVDVRQRLIVVDPTPVTSEGTRVQALVNPELLEYSGSAVLEEGCLSIPGIYAEVRRPEKIRVRYQDAGGESREEEFAGLMARVIQHEMDHLDGKLFIDHLSPMRRSLLMKKLRAIDAERRRPGLRL